VPKLGGAAKMAGVVSALRRLRAESWTPDVVHAHEYRAGLPARLAARSSGAPLIISEHSSDVALGRLTSRQRSAARRSFGRAAVVCPVSQSLAARLETLTGDARVVAVPNAVDTDLFHPAGGDRADRRIRLLAVGNLVEVKGHRHLIDALRIVLDEGLDASLDIVGDGPARHELEERAGRLGLRGDVEFHGHVTRQAVADAMRAADVLVLPSLWETMGCVLAEALASGIPCVATRVGGVEEVIDDRTGVLVEPASPEALAAGILTVARERERFGASELREVAVQRFGHDAVGRRWTDLYSDAIGARGDRHARWHGETAHA
jgi:glycosyltransferase involved in cell wall biosynthesis